ncbi:hypothetical protein [Carboxylicivirga sp. M1479]|uniref:hypothetical protein n=1 Tax=Carboxylicivirga sp. M1479 TaxID=2594476 RepID=UPI001177862B|nr:hypothetical protein [Carboxylicivirga sp. M1479]TRX64260.1 hypothetical protein FNN09_18035 [Carboxylicivirga sp. M1479]
MPQHQINNKSFRCFVCEQNINSVDVHYHSKVNMPICSACNNTLEEREKVNELLDGLADGFVCGCI